MPAIDNEHKEHLISSNHSVNRIIRLIFQRDLTLMAEQIAIKADFPLVKVISILKSIFPDWSELQNGHNANHGNYKRHER